MGHSPDRRALLRQFGALTGSSVILAAVHSETAEAAAASVLSVPPPTADASATFAAAFRALSNTRTSPPDLDGWGVGTIASGRGRWGHRGPLQFAASQVGFVWRGEGNYATSHLFDLATAAAVPLKTYVAVSISDLYLRNTAKAPGSSVGISLEPTGGGGPLTVKRVAIDGFGTGIAVLGTVNGDKALIEQTSFAAAVGFDNGSNKQAVGWTFLNCSGECARAHFRLGGAGEIGIQSYVGNVFGSFVELPESSGNGGSANMPARLTVSGTQLEYHGTGPRLLVDAGKSRKLGDSGGTNADIVLREVSLVSGSTPPDPTRHVVIQVGDDRGASDAVRVKQVGGWIEGVIRHGSAQQGALNRRWSFRDALRAPHPDVLQLHGTGNHPLMEWRANENVPIDQYRGGQGFTGAIDAQKAFLWRHIGSSLINTGVEATAIGGRWGSDFAIGRFPPGATQTALGVYLDRPLPPGLDLEVTQFEDRASRVGLSEPFRLSSGAPKGLHRVHDRWHILTDGVARVRITLSSRGIAVPGAIVVFYFPYMGS